MAGVLIHQATEGIDWALHDYPDATREELQAAGGTIIATSDEVVEAEFSENYKPHEWKVFGKQDASWWHSVGIPASLDAYIDWRLSKPSWTLAEIPGFGPAIEVPFQLGLGELQVNGWIDRIFVVDGHEGEYFPVDIKSGRKPATSEQLALYAHALDEGLHWPLGYGYYVYDLKSGKAKTTDAIRLDYWTHDDLSGIYNTADEVIRRGLFVPKPGDACFTCDVQEHCKFKQAAI